MPKRMNIYKKRKLLLEAREATEWRNHTLGKFVPDKPIEQTYTWYAICKVCSMGVQVQMYPAPNGIDIGGEAAALNCRG